MELLCMVMPCYGDVMELSRSQAANPKPALPHPALPNKNAIITDRHAQSMSKQTASALCQMSRACLEGLAPAATTRDR